MRKLRLFMATALLTLSVGMTAFAGAWQAQENGQWKYQNDDGSYATGWIEDSGKNYYLDANGIMLANTTTPDGKQVGADGALIPAPLFDYDLPDCHVTYTKHEIAKDHNGDPCLILYYNYTNKSAEAKSAMGNTCYIEAYQHGVECDYGYLSYDDDNQATENHYKSVLTGTTIEVAEVYKITDTSDVTLILSDLFDWKGESPTLTVVLSLN